MSGHEPKGAANGLPPIPRDEVPDFQRKALANQALLLELLRVQLAEARAAQAASTPTPEQVAQEAADAEWRERSRVAQLAHEQRCVEQLELHYRTTVAMESIAESLRTWLGRMP